MSTALKLPPEVATILAMLTGLLGAVLTTLGAAPADANAAVTALQYVLSAVVLIAGLVGHLHVHSQHVQAQNAAMASLAFTPIPQPPASNAPVSPSYVAPQPLTTLQPTPLTMVAPGISVPLANTSVYVPPNIAATATYVPNFTGNSTAMSAADTPTQAPATDASAT